jgi:hypothetical protein
MQRIVSYLSHAFAVSSADVALNLTVTSVVEGSENPDPVDTLEKSLREVCWRRLQEECAPLALSGGFFRRNLKHFLVYSIFPDHLKLTKQILARKTLLISPLELKKEDSFFKKAYLISRAFAISEVSHSCILWIAKSVAQEFSATAAAHFDSQIMPIEQLVFDIVLQLGVLYLSCLEE